MAVPRVFISSTCYDLKELRSQIREFINDYGYDPVLSEYGDIFFEYGTHPQDACFAEVAKCHMFLLIIGNTYGSFYHNSDTVKPASVTMKEFEEALDKKIPKHVFINRFVEYDYQNYSRAWANKLKLNKGKGILSDDPNEVDKLKEEFDSLYPFPHESYRHLFRFINLLYKNNVSVDMTAKEFDLLYLFISNPGKVYSRENLLEMIWKYDYLGDLRTVDVHIRRLREKVETDPSHPRYIHTKWGVGYYFAER